MPWYEGTSLLHHLENVHIGSDHNLIDVRFPVQYVMRPQSDAFHDYRGYAGTVAGGTIKVGDEVMVLPSGLTTRVVGIDLLRRGAARGAPADVGDGQTRRRPRHQPWRHDLPTAQPPPRDAGPRRDGGLDAAGHPHPGGRPLPHQADHAHGQDASSRSCSTGSTSTTCTATRSPRRSGSTRSAESPCG